MCREEKGLIEQKTWYCCCCYAREWRKIFCQWASCHRYEMMAKKKPTFLQSVPFCYSNYYCPKSISLPWGKNVSFDKSPAWIIVYGVTISRLCSYQGNKSNCSTFCPAPPCLCCNVFLDFLLPILCFFAATYFFPNIRQLQRCAVWGD